MRLKITLTQPADEVRRLIKLAAHGTDDTGITLWIKNCSWSFAGRIYLRRKPGSGIDAERWALKRLEAYRREGARLE